MCERFVVYEFENLNDVLFDAKDYSLLKFGSDRVARLFGYQMGDKFYKEYKDLLINNRCVIIPSAFNVVEIASTILARQFMNRLNHLLTRDGYRIVDWTTMHRTMSYIADYCLMSKEDRQALLKGDKLYINRDYIKDKVLIFVDDIIITGTHEHKIIDFLKELDVNNRCIFCYYAQYIGDSAEIEYQLNHSGINNIDDYIKLIKDHRWGHHLVVRAVRFLLDQSINDLIKALEIFDDEFVEKLYFACLCKEYDKITGYKNGFELIKARFDEIGIG